jgi:transcriptional regulator with XRE-family HTH domain
MATKDLFDYLPKDSTAGSITRAFRRNYKITLKELSKLTGIPESNLSAIENDKLEIGVKRATLIGAALGISPESLLFPNGRSQYEKEAERVRHAAEKLFASKRRQHKKDEDEAA